MFEILNIIILIVNAFFLVIDFVCAFLRQKIVLYSEWVMTLRKGGGGVFKPPYKTGPIKIYYAFKIERVARK